MKNFYFLLFLFTGFYSCTRDKPDLTEAQGKEDIRKEPGRNTISDSLVIKKEFLYNEHTLEDEYPYKDTVRKFQWNKIKKRLTIADSLRQLSGSWGILQNYKNMNGIAALTKEYRRDKYKNIADTFGVERYQNIPLYRQEDMSTPFRYSLDGSLVRILGDTSDSTKLVKVQTTSYRGDWYVPIKFLKPITIPVTFKKVIMVDKENQNITTLERTDSARVWKVLSMNPCTTGLYNPPHQMETPNGLFIIQEKKRKMFYYKDGTKNIAGYAPYASRFTGGGYLHGVPLVYPHTKETEFSYTLGTTPRSHMCVRNATSHAKFIYEWGDVNNTLVFVYE